MTRRHALQALSQGLVALTLAACQEDGAPPAPPRRPDAALQDGGAADAAVEPRCESTLARCAQGVDDALQAQRWVSPAQCGPDGTAGVTCTVLTFVPGGTYRWATLSDGQPVVRTGSYEALCTGERAGLLALGADAALSFELQPQRLLLSGLSLVPRAKGEVEPGADPSDRPTFLPEGFCALADGPWRKANSFDTDTMPERVTFGMDGHARFEYRGDSCSHELPWGVREGKLLASERDNTCDLRQTGPQTRQYALPIEIDDRGVLHLSAEYHRERDPRSAELITLRSGALVLSLELDGRLRSGAQIEYRGRLEHGAGGDALTVQSVRATVTPIAMQPGGFDVSGATQSLFDQRLDIALGASERAEFEGRLKTEATGTHAVLLELLYSSGGRSLKTQRSLVITLAP